MTALPARLHLHSSLFIPSKASSSHGVRHSPQQQKGALPHIHPNSPTMGPFSNLTKQKCHIQFMSDLHLERIKYEYEIQKSAPILLLAGDIGRFHDAEAYTAFLRKQCEQFDKVLLVAGNHEFYGSSRESGLDVAAELEKEENLTFLNRTRVDLTEGNVVVLGCTLQSRIDPERTRLTNDFARIENWTVAKHNAEHELDLTWLRENLATIATTESNKRVVIATHYAPAFEKTTHPKNERNAFSGCFSSDTLAAFRDWAGAGQVDYWIFGHTHWNARFKCGNTTVISNQLCNDDRDLGWLKKWKDYRAFDPMAVLKV